MRILKVKVVLGDGIDEEKHLVFDCQRPGAELVGSGHIYPAEIRLLADIQDLLDKYKDHLGPKQRIV